MKYKLLRAFIRRKKLEEPYKLTGELVIDGKSFFHSSYKNSNCQYLLGGEYDRYANHVRSMLDQLCNVTCYIIFNGAMHEELEGRLELHQRKINEANSILSRYADDEYTDVTIFSRFVCRDIIEERGIKYYTAEYSSTEAMVTLAKQKRCPILTNNFEMCFYGVSCITPGSLRYDNEKHCMTALIYRAENILPLFKLYRHVIPSFLTFMDEDSPIFSMIPKLTNCNKDKTYLFVQCLTRWIQRRTKNDVINTIEKFVESKQKNIVLSSIEQKDKILYSNDKTVLNYLRVNEPGIIDESDWFAKGVAKGSIIGPLINLSNSRIFSGSWLVSDHNKEDAMLPALNIVFFAQALLTQNTNVKFKFIGRRDDESHAWEIEQQLDVNLPQRAIFRTRTIDLLKLFINYHLPGFKYKLLTDVPEECWLIIITLVYYSVGRDVLNLAYAVLLSYVIVGPVTQEVGIIRRSRIFEGNNNAEDGNATFRFGLTRRDCLAAAGVVISFFYGDTAQVFNKELLHSLSEFKHCWYMMIVLNKLAGERVKSTKFHEAYNGTFVYNVLLFLRKAPDPLEAVRALLGETTVFKLFQKIALTYEEILLFIKK